jgi:polysaccharide export outer membrane protein
MMGNGFTSTLSTPSLARARRAKSLLYGLRNCGLLCVALVLTGATCGLPDTTGLPEPDLQRTEVLGSGDVVEVRVFNEPDLSGTHQVSEGGTIRLPLVGTLQAAGLSPDELTMRIADTYNHRYLRNAEVSLFVKERNSQKVFVLGQVAKPGAVAVNAGRMTVIEAIAAAGGTTKFADASRALLTREKEGKQVRVAVDVAAIGKGQAPDVELQPGDILYVPETLF